MRSTIHAVALSLAGVVLASGVANAAPTISTKPSTEPSGIQKVQEFGIYIGPRYRGYRDYDYGYGYGYGYNPDYYYGPRRYYYGDGYRYRSERRTFRHLQRQAP